MNDKVYRLYAFTITQESVELAENERFTRITPSYVLIYTQNDVDGSAYEITPKDYGRLTEKDKQWLKDCHVISFSEQIEANKPKIEEKAKEILNALAKNIQSEFEDKGCDKVVLADGDNSTEPNG